MPHSIIFVCLHRQRVIAIIIPKWITKINLLSLKENLLCLFSTEEEDDARRKTKLPWLLFDGDRWAKNCSNNEKIACILFWEFNIIDLLTDTISTFLFSFYFSSTSSCGRENVLRESSDKEKYFYWDLLARSLAVLTDQFLLTISWNLKLFWELNRLFQSAILNVFVPIWVEVL